MKQQEQNDIEEIITMNKDAAIKRDAWLSAKQIAADAKKEYDEAIGNLTQLISDIEDEKKQPKLPGIAKAADCEE